MPTMASRMRTNTTLALFVAVVLVGTGVTAAQGQELPGVTLETSRSVIDLGTPVQLSGEISPPSGGETVSIVDEHGRERAIATTDANGGYKVRLAPRYTRQFRARWLAAMSEPETVKVRPKVTVRLERVRLFGAARIRGTVRPVQEQGRVTVVLTRAGSRLWQRKLPLRAGRHFSTSFRVRKPGSHRARASFTDAARVRGVDRSRRVTPPLPSLRPGSQSVHVKLLERRLRDLAYHLDGADRRYNQRTADAVRAFNKIEGRARVGTVGDSTWRALANAGRPRARYRTEGFHIEVDQTRQVVLVVEDGKVTGTVHASTGANGYTHDGTYRVYRKIAGYSGGKLYYPSYFDGRRALHGWPEVPTYNASHGCVRLPMWTAKWVHRQAVMGTTIRIYH